MLGFKKGIVDGLPICFGYLSVSFAFGIFAIQSGLSILETLLISMCNVTSAGQLAGVPIITSGGGLVTMVGSQLVINLRYALMSVSLSQKLDRTIRLPHKFLIAFVNTDEVFAVASSQKDKVSKRYMFGLILTPYVGWSLGTRLGAVAGSLLPEIVLSALGIAIYGMFVAIVVPQARAQRATAICVLLAMALSCLFHFAPLLSAIPEGVIIIICAVLAALVMALVAPIPTEEVSGRD